LNILYKLTHQEKTLYKVAILFAEGDWRHKRDTIWWWSL